MKKNRDIKLIGVILEVDGKRMEFDKFELEGWETQGDCFVCAERGVDLTVKINDKDCKINAESQY